MLKGELQQTVPARELELLADVGAVRFDGAMTDKKLGRDFPRSFAFSNAFEDSPLRGSQIIEPRPFPRQQCGAVPALQHEVAECGAYVGIAFGNRGDAVENLRRSGLFEHITVDAQIQRGVERLFFLCHRKDDNARGAFFGFQGVHNFEPAHVWQMEVEHGHVRDLLQNYLDSFLTSASFANNFEARILLDGLTQSLPEQGMVIHNDYTNLFVR
jgi:hypothetical protein